ncbi:HIRAN domain-containing protein [Streptococcus constellatus]|uniref:HIRAN domain-containing protein n=1 Tax=Streptococcus constellatus TaxID=76860 RepID=UPI0021043F12|nr:HIRAN domain-containing protein [Streptococcus constellatus]UTX64793.1 hypothetical protein DEH83_05705 [Streptococcus constellatus]
MKEIYRTFTAVAGTEYRKEDARKAYNFICDSKNEKTNEVRFEPEPTNPYDHYAIKIYIFDIFVGYIPRKQLRKLRKMLHEPDKYKCIATAEPNWWDEKDYNFIIFYKFYE